MNDLQYAITGLALLAVAMNASRMFAHLRGQPAGIPNRPPASRHPASSVATPADCVTAIAALARQLHKTIDDEARDRAMATYVDSLIAQRSKTVDCAWIDAARTGDAPPAAPLPNG